MSKTTFSDALCQPYELKGNERGVLLLHGFTGSPSHLRPAGEYLNAAGYTVHGLLLPGHNTSLEDMTGIKREQWFECAQAGLDRLRRECGTVSVLGLSMGGLIALWLAQHNDVKCCITYSAPVGVRNILAQYAKGLAPLFPKILQWPVSVMPRGRGFLTEYDYGYNGLPVNGVIEMNELTNTVMGNIAAVTAPLLICQSDRDETIKPRSMQLIYDGASSQRKEKLRLTRSSHIISLGPERELLFSRTLEWLNYSHS